HMQSMCLGIDCHPRSIGLDDIHVYDERRSFQIINGHSLGRHGAQLPRSVEIRADIGGRVGQYLGVLPEMVE
ncbi:MAG TPA: hypothetical protein VG893_12410, partial [Terracidiphilus sp.]|nr:hypothetical protein [Terracidiphilus sp.]